MTFGNLSAVMNVAVWAPLTGQAAQNVKLNSSTMKVALFGNTGTPDNTALAVGTPAASYGTGPWVTGNEVTDITNWVAGGRALGAPTSPPAIYAAQNYVMLDAADTAGGGNVTLANVYGDLVYDPAITTPAASLGLAYHAYGGPQGVTAGTFTVIWNPSGIARWTHTPA